MIKKNLFQCHQQQGSCTNIPVGHRRLLLFLLWQCSVGEGVRSQFFYLKKISLIRKKNCFQFCCVFFVSGNFVFGCFSNKKIFFLSQRMAPEGGGGDMEASDCNFETNFFAVAIILFDGLDPISIIAIA